MTYKVYRGIEATTDEQIFIFNNNYGTQCDVEGAYMIDRDLFFKATPDGATVVTGTGIVNPIENKVMSKLISQCRVCALRTLQTVYSSSSRRAKQLKS